MNSLAFIGNIGGGEIILFGLVVFIFALIPLSFYYYSLSKVLKVCSEKNRLMTPGHVWLNFIPLFGLGWIFYTVSRISESVVEEYHDLGISNPTTGAKGIGIAYGVLSAINIIPILNYLTVIPCLVCWVIHWVQISSCISDIERKKRRLEV